MRSPSAFARRRIGEPEVPAWFAIASLKGSPPEVWNDTCSSTTSQEHSMQTPASTIPQSPHQAINSLSPGDRRVLNENELAQRWGVSPKTLQRWRSEGRGPRYLKLSKRVGYPVDAVIEFERQALHDSTSERAAV